MPATAANVTSKPAAAELERQEAESAVRRPDRAPSNWPSAVVIAAKSGDRGKLFGSVGTRDIAEAITAGGLPSTRAVRLPTARIRNTGEYTVTLHLHTDVNAEVSVTIVAE